MRGRSTVSLLIAVVLLLSACTTSGNDRSDKESVTQSYRSGSQGISMKFLPNLPPSRTFDSEDFNVFIEVENKGAANIPGAGDRIYVSGFDPNIVTNIPFTGQSMKLAGKDQYTLQGEVSTAQFKGIVRRLTTDAYPLTLIATACYGYETQASSTVCIDPDPYAISTRVRACTPGSVGLGSEGAPVAVTSIEVDPRPRKTVFKIHISNVGGGDVFRYGGNTLAKCSPYTQQGLNFDEIDYVQLSDVLVSGVSIKNSCKPLDKDHIRLSGGSGTVMCELSNIRSNAAYTTPITVILKYGYRNQIQQTTEILRSS